MSTRTTIGIFVSILIFLVTISYYLSSQPGDRIESAQLESPVSIQSVPVEEFDKLLNETDVLLLDVRTPAEYARGYINGARNIDFNDPEFQQVISTLDRDVSYAIYCQSDKRSSQVLDLMRSLGFTNVTDLTGGINAWQGAGNTLVN